jgi:capsular exopolysaccharide synthesis family protein
MSEPSPSVRRQALVAAPQARLQKHLVESDVHVLDRLAVLYRYRYIGVSVFVLITVAIMIQGYTTLQQFQAQGRLLIESERSTALPGLQSADQYYEDPQTYYNTQYKIIRGRDLTRRVVRKLHLENYPEFNGTADPPRTPLTMLRGLGDRFAEMIAPGLPATAPAPAGGASLDEASLIDAFLGRVDVKQVPESRLVDVTFQSIDPQFSALAVNSLLEEYVEQNLAVKITSTQSTLEWLDAELGKQQKKVEDSERGLAQYRERQNAMSLDDRSNIVVTRYQKVNDELLKARSEKAQKQAQYEQVKSIATGTSPDVIPTIVQNAQVVQAKNKLGTLKQERAKLLERYGPKYPPVAANASAIDEAQSQLDLEVARAMQQVKTEYDTAVLAEQTLAKNADAARADVADLGRKSVDYNVMEREAKSNHAVYDTLLQQEKALRVSSNSRANNVRIVDRAEVPKGPMTPAGRRTWFMSLSIGFAVAVAVAFGLDYMNDTIKTPEDINQRLRVPFLGLVPSVRGDKHPLLASSHVPHDFGESFRALRTSLISKYTEPGTKILAVTSAQPLEGKTIAAANIAMALAYGGARVLLVDADMRRPGLHRPLRLSNDRGLSQVLNGQARVRDVIQRTVDPNLLAITAGNAPPNPSELLSSERMKTLLTNLSHGAFDWVLIDTPPVLAVTDAVILAPTVDGVVYVVGAEMTRRRLAERALETLLSANPKSISVVLNKVDFTRNKYYYSRYYGHQYKNYYAGASA